MSVIHSPASRTAIAVLAFLAASGAGAGCPRDPVPGPAAKPATCPDPEAGTKVTIRIGLAALASLRAAGPEKPAIVAPESLKSLLAMLAAGAEGKTRKAFVSLLGDAAPSAIPPSPNYRSSAAAWLDEGFGVAPAFARELRSGFGAQFSILPLRTAPDEGVAAINDWARTATGGRIPGLLEQLPADTDLVLATAAEFAAPWKQAFDPERTAPASFTLASGEAIKVPMLATRLDLVEYGEAQTARLVRLPYATPGVHADLVLPRDAEAAKACLVPDDPCDWVTGLSTGPVAVDLSVPKLAVQGRGNLLGALEALGLGIALDAARSDFGGMTGIKQDKGPELAAIESAAALKLDEAGTEAAAAQAAVMTARSTRLADEAVSLAFNRPFLVVIRDGASGMPLFVAWIPDPR